MSMSENFGHPFTGMPSAGRRACAALAAFLLSLSVSSCALGIRHKPADSGTGDIPGSETVHTDTSAAPDSQPDTSAPPVSSAGTEEPQTSPPVTSPPVTSPPVTSPPVTSPPGTVPPDTVPPDTVPPETTAPEPEAPHVVEVGAGTAVDDSYFSDALFIGDSRTVGLSLYSGLKTNYYSEVGLNVSTVQTKAFVPSGDDKLTLADALDANRSFKKVYISFGINEIGWNSTDSFIKSYTSLVELIGEKLPDADIFIQAILPMTKSAAESERYSAMGGNRKIAEYNERLYKLCEEKGLYYINLSEIFADENGNLSITDSGDGIHLGVASSRAWADYLRTHTVS